MNFSVFLLVLNTVMNHARVRKIKVDLRGSWA